MHPKPRIPIPDPQTAVESGTWAYKTISVRFENTIRRLLAENQFSAELKNNLQALIADIPNQPLRELNDYHAPDCVDWNRMIQPYLGWNWHHPPWLVTEHYFYRRILEATQYFKPGIGYGIDPYSYPKRMGLQFSANAIASLMTQTNQWVQQANTSLAGLQNLLYFDLWGNQADYSLWPAETDQKPDHQNLKQAQKHILADDSAAVAGFIALQKDNPRRIDFLLDNSGFELVCDLALADYLLSCGFAQEVRLHVKAHPTFVSDAIEQDVRETIAYLFENEHPAVQAVGARLWLNLRKNRLQITYNWVWNSPLSGWELPDIVRTELSESALVIIKGDANYRRILGDRHWPFTTPFEDILSYFPAPLVALRTLKSELVCGLRPGQAEDVAARDPEWLINGRWGLIQTTLIPKSTSH